MHIRTARILAIASLLATLQACAPAQGHNYSVSDAYQASDTVAISNYNRSIFSSNNF
jgi:hypothetical protein